MKKARRGKRTLTAAMLARVRLLLGCPGNPRSEVRLYLRLEAYLLRRLSR